jgi:ABC-type multidrug transport system ATPase subunit
MRYRAGRLENLPHDVDPARDWIRSHRMWYSARIRRRLHFANPKSEIPLPKFLRMIEVVDVTQHYGIRPVLRKINLSIPPRSLAAVIGPNGMGKSTLLAVIAGVLTPQHGYVEIDGLRRKSSIENELTIRRRVVYLPDRPWLPKNRTGREFLLGVGRLYDIPVERLIDHVERLLQLFELDRLGDSPIRTYSAGQQKKISLSSALVTEANILLLDEPFSGGLDPSGILALKHVLRRIAEDGGAILMTTPVPELVDELADRLIILREGQIAVQGTLHDLQRETRCSGGLAEVLERLISPHTLENLDRYFEGRP